MQTLFYSAQLGSIILDYLGCIPARYYLKSSNRNLYGRVSPMVQLTESEYIMMLRLNVLNHRCLRLRDPVLSPKLVEAIASAFDTWDTRRAWRARHDCFCSIWDGWSVDCIAGLRRHHLTDLLLASCNTGDVRRFELALDLFLERSHGPIYQRADVLSWFQAIFRHDSLGLLQSLIGKLKAEITSYESLISWAIKYQASRCLGFIEEVSGSDRRDISQYLSCLVCSGDINSVTKELRSRSHSREELRAALDEVVCRRNLEIARILGGHWTSLFGSESFNSLVPFLFESAVGLHVWDSEDNAQTCRADPSPLLAWLLEDIENVQEFIPSLDMAIKRGYKDLCSLLVSKGVREFSFPDLLCFQGHNNEFVEFLVALLNLNLSRFQLGIFANSSPDVISYLIRNGIGFGSQARVTAITILESGYNNRAFSDWVEPLRLFLQQRPEMAFKEDLALSRLALLPLGFIAYLEAPVIASWDGRKVVRFNRELIEPGPGDVWLSGIPDPQEIKALEQMKRMLIEHGADPAQLCSQDAIPRLTLDLKLTPAILNLLIEGKADVNAQWRGKTALAYSEKSRSREERQCLLTAGAR